MDLKDFNVQVKKVRLRLLKNAPYFGMALIKLARVRESSIQDTAWTDGRSIVFSEEFIKEITPEQCNFVLLHMRKLFDWNIGLVFFFLIVLRILLLL